MLGNKATAVLTQELAKLKREVVKLEELLALTNGDATAPRPRGRPLDDSGKSFTARVCTALESFGREATADEVLARVVEDGYKTDAKTPLASLVSGELSRLFRKNLRDVSRTEEGLYAIKQE